MSGREHAWLRGYRTWDAYYAVALITVLAFVLTLEDPTARSRPLASALLLCCAAWYAVHGRRLMRSEAHGPRGVRYLGVLLVPFAAAVAFAPAASLALIALVPQVYWVLRPSAATGAVVVFASVPVATEAVRTGTLASGLADQGPTALVIITFSALFGTWAHRIIDQSRERAALIEELASTRAELAEVSRQAGMAAERERIAGEVHDAVAQGLSSIVLLVQATGSTLERLTGLSDPHGRALGQARDQLDLVARTARESLAEAGALVEALRPAALDTGSLPEALRRLTTRAAEDSGLATRFALRGSPEPLPVAVEVTLLRSTQEALANVRKHARASSVEVTLSYTEETVAVRVSDDGAGVEAPGGEPRGYGLAGMGRRLEQVGGRRELHSASGEGTTLMVEVPR